MAQNCIGAHIARRGVHVPAAYQADVFAQARVIDYASRAPISLAEGDILGNVRAWLDTEAPGSHHQGYPVVDAEGRVLGVLTRKDLHRHDADATKPVGALLRRSAVCVGAGDRMDEARRRMAALDIGRLPVLAEDGSGRLVGMITRSDLLGAYRDRLRERFEPEG